MYMFLFYDEFSTQTPLLRLIVWQVYNELEIVWTEVIVACFCVDILRRTTKNQKPDSRYSGWYSNRTPPECKSEEFLIDNLSYVGERNFLVINVEKMALILTDYKYSSSLTRNLVKACDV